MRLLKEGNPQHCQNHDENNQAVSFREAGQNNGSRHPDKIFDLVSFKKKISEIESQAAKQDYEGIIGCLSVNSDQIRVQGQQRE
jgi:hypothetical protein